jgi:hypothetical protein
MTEADTRRAPAAPRRAEQEDLQHDERRAEEEAERRLGGALALGLPVATVVAALIVGFVASIPSALLVLASGVLLGAVSLLWASVRTLSGDAPLPEDLEIIAAQSEEVDGLAEQKRRILRALKDLENEKAIGRIDAADYDAMASHYRDEAKAIMKQMDDRVAPAMAEAEKLAREYLAEHAVAPAPAEKPAAASGASRVPCSSCGASNEVDAAFCKQCGKGLARPEGSDATA